MGLVGGRRARHMRTGAETQEDDMMHGKDRGGMGDMDDTTPTYGQVTGSASDPAVAGTDATPPSAWDASDVTSVVGFIVNAPEGLLARLLVDRTMTYRDNFDEGAKSQKKSRWVPHNITFATDAYAGFGDGYGVADQITIPKITGENLDVICPRVLRGRGDQGRRTKAKAEVFTPSWLVNRMNNAVDEAYLGRPDAFNAESGDHRHWESTDAPVFPRGGDRDWHDYVGRRCMEITCGEAPFLVSRYDATTGEAIAVGDRVGVLDRKLRVICENAKKSPASWHEEAKRAYKSTYAYEWQGDNLLIARINLLLTYADYYRCQWGEDPAEDDVEEIAGIITWNAWQMNGLTGTVPYVTEKREQGQPSLFAGIIDGMEGDVRVVDVRERCIIRDWEAGSGDRANRYYM